MNSKQKIRQRGAEDARIGKLISAFYEVTGFWLDEAHKAEYEYGFRTARGQKTKEPK